MGGHVSKDMLKHYSHIRTHAKRRAVDALVSRPGMGSHSSDESAATMNSTRVPQVGLVN